MAVFQCAGCPSGPCVLINMDPEYECSEDCPKVGMKKALAVWRELEVVE